MHLCEFNSLEGVLNSNVYIMTFFFKKVSQSTENKHLRQTNEERQIRKANKVNTPRESLFVTLMKEPS